MLRTPKTAFSTLLLLALFVMAWSPKAQAQTPEAEVLAVVNTLFDGMRAGDSTMVRSTFHPNAVMGTTFTDRNGNPALQPGSLTNFLTAVGTPHDQVWDERIWDPIVHVRDNLATAWTPYVFYAGDNFSHCGVNSFTFARTNDGWKIIHLVDTRQRQGCEIPDSVKK